MTNAASLNRTLFISDNLPILRGIDSESVDLIATDPPFNKGVKAFEGIVDAGVGREGRKVSYKDTWTWGDVQEEWTEAIKTDHPNLHAVIQAANVAAGEDMGAFLCWLAVRVLEMHRILKPTGSLYLHIDHTAGAYTKAILDAIFERNNFRNEIVWKRSGGKSDAHRWGVTTDRLLFYTKSERYTWNQQYQPLEPTYVAGAYRYDDGDGRGAYRRLPLHAAGVRHGDSGTVWRGYNPSIHNRHWAMPTKGSMHQYIVEYGLVKGWPDDYTTMQEKLEALDRGGLVVHSDSYLPEIKTYLSSTRGIAATDLISDIPMASGNERTGYPTQKPITLYERILKASSNEGDLVLDPFAGCATTCVAAEKLGRDWIAIDINEEAAQVTKDRLQKEARLPLGSRSWNRAVRVRTSAPRRTDDGAKAAPELTLVSPQPKAPRLTVRELRGRLILMDGMQCQGCGWVPHHEEYLEVDHRVPKSRDGRDDLRNRVLLCAPCNGAKGNKLTLAELRERRIRENRMVDKSWDRAWYERTGRFG